MYDIKFDFANPPIRTYACTAARWSVLTSLYGRVATSLTARFTAKLVDHWRHRLAAIRDAGWLRAQEDRAFYYGARNCWPSTIRPSGGQTRYCNLWFCPFCWGRKVVEVYNRLDAWGKRFAQEEGWCRYATRQLTYRRERDRQMFPTSEEQVRAAYEGLVIRRRRTTRKAVSLGSLSVWTVAPYGTFIPGEESPTEDASAREDLSVGISQFFWIGGPDHHEAAFPVLEGNFKTYVQLTRKLLVRILANLMRYPVTWLRSAPEAMIPLITVREEKRARSLAWTGKFYGGQQPTLHPDPKMRFWMPVVR